MEKGKWKQTAEGKEKVVKLMKEVIRGSGSEEIEEWKWTRDLEVERGIKRWEIKEGIEGGEEL